LYQPRSGGSDASADRNGYQPVP